VVGVFVPQFISQLTRIFCLVSMAFSSRQCLDLDWSGSSLFESGFAFPQAAATVFEALDD
jgi:hypothetical protein